MEIIRVQTIWGKISLQVSGGRTGSWKAPDQPGCVLAAVPGGGGYQGAEQSLLGRIVGGGVFRVPLDGEDPAVAGFGQLDGLDDGILG